MKKLKSLVALFFVLSANGCASLHIGKMDSTSTALNALASTKFTYVKMGAKGTSTVKYVFGFGGFDEESLLNDAKNDLLKNNPLGNNQALTNTIVSYKTTFITLFFIQVECLISADIVQFERK
jgi:hypothetical protein